MTICSNEMAGVGKAAPLTGKGSAGETGSLAKEASAGVYETAVGRREEKAEFETRSRQAASSASLYLGEWGYLPKQKLGP